MLGSSKALCTATTVAPSRSGTKYAFRAAIPPLRIDLLASSALPVATFVPASFASVVVQFYACSASIASISFDMLAGVGYLVDMDNHLPPVSHQALGGIARAEKLTPEQRKDIARTAADARWNRLTGPFGEESIPRATHPGTLSIGDLQIPCAVLENGKRVITQRGMFVSLGMNKNPTRGQSANDNRPGFLSAKNLTSFISNDLERMWSPIPFRLPKGSGGYRGNIAFGYEAKILPLVCHVYLDAKEAGKLTKAQLHIAQVCKIVERAFSIIGIVALIDEATGYQDERPRDELSRILEAYIAPELMPWTRMFPQEFFKQIYRIQGWAYQEGSAKRTPYVGKLINKYVYEQLPPGTLEELRRLNPLISKGQRRHKHFQFLTPETGNVHLDKQITTVTTLLRISDDKTEFERNFNKAFGHPYSQPLFNWVKET